MGDSIAVAGAYLTLPRLRRGPLPLPPQAGGEGLRARRKDALIVINASPPPTRVEQFLQPEQVEVLGPRLWTIKIAAEVFPDAPLGILPQLGGVEIEVFEERFVKSIALVRRRPEGHL